MRSQTESGKAFEYAVANQIAVIFSVEIQPEAAFDRLHAAFISQSREEQKHCLKAADEAITFLIAFDKRFEETASVLLPPAMSGKRGDVRDVVALTSGGEEIGISAKNRHRAVKHSRLSAKIDFGKEWLGSPCTDLYWRDIASIFAELEKRRGGYWREIPDKQERFYVPLLNAFLEELKGLHRKNPAKVSESLLRYLLGKHDFYKVVKENGEVSVQSYNFAGTLEWGSRTKLRGEIVQARMKRGSKTTAEVIFDNGWNLSFRIHNASSLIEPSLKFDIQIIGLPPSVKNQEIKLG